MTHKYYQYISPYSMYNFSNFPQNLNIDFHSIHQLDKKFCFWSWVYCLGNWCSFPPSQYTVSPTKNLHKHSRLHQDNKRLDKFHKIHLPELFRNHRIYFDLIVLPLLKVLCSQSMLFHSIWNQIFFHKPDYRDGIECMFLKFLELAHGLTTIRKFLGF